MRWFPKGYGGERRSPEHLKRDGWHDQNVLVVSPDDHRLTWPERGADPSNRREALWQAGRKGSMPCLTSTGRRR